MSRTALNLKPQIFYFCLLLLVCGQVVAKPAIGWLEYVHIDEANLRLEAKIDTGADSTSINADVLQTFTFNGDNWIRFRLSDKHGHTAEIERKIERYVKIKRKLLSSDRRPVIKLGICVGNIYRNVNVNLAQRKNFKYRMLIGRNYLRGLYTVDVALSHTVSPTCQGIKGD